eukprot:6207725-Pleurochrysis_carterae.AAC.1
MLRQSSLPRPNPFALSTLLACPFPSLPSSMPVSQLCPLHIPHILCARSYVHPHCRCCISAAVRSAGIERRRRMAGTKGAKERAKERARERSLGARGRERGRESESPGRRA